MILVTLVLVVALFAPAVVQADEGPAPSSTPSPTPSASPSSQPSQSPSSSPSPTADKKPSPSGEPSASGQTTRSPEPVDATESPAEDELPPPLVPSLYGYGPYDNSSLVAMAARLQSFGHTEDYVRKHAFAPFIIAGYAHWENSWGALRHDPDGTWRRHLGQDVFCERGTPVLAAEAGKIGFGSDRLGGLVARLYRDEGGYFYYAHLAGWNTEEFNSGDRVTEGDVIGYCGSSGNAEGTDPHVHFGHYAGGPLDPMGFLLDWNSAAKRRAGRLLDELVDLADVSSTARRFGDGLLSGLGGESAEMPIGSLDLLVQAVLESGNQAIPRVTPSGGFPESFAARLSARK